MKGRKDEDGEGGEVPDDSLGGRGAHGCKSNKRRLGGPVG